MVVNSSHRASTRGAQHEMRHRDGLVADSLSAYELLVYNFSTQNYKCCGLRFDGRDSTLKLQAKSFWVDKRNLEDCLALALKEIEVCLG